jgi:hypothetical protein
MFVGRTERTDADGLGLTFFDFRGDRRLGAFLRGVEQYVEFGAQGDQLAVRGRLGFGQAGGVEFRDARMGGDLLVQHRLGEGRLVGLVVAVATVADDIQHGVGAELLAVLERDLGREHDGVRVVAVGVEDRRLGELGDFGAMTAGTGLVGVGGEADLVVRDDVQRAAHLIALEAGEVEGLHDHALTGERGVAVQQDGEDLGAVGAALEVDERAGAAEDDGIDGFEVAGIEGEGDADLLAFDDAGAGVAEVILHVAVTMRGVRDVLLGEAGEEGFGLLAADVDEDVETTAVGHADDEVGDTGGRGAMDQLIHDGEHDFAAFDGEALGADEGLVEEAFELFGLHDGAQEAATGRRVISRTEAAAFDAFLQPAAALAVLDVAELDANGAAVSRLQLGEDVAQREHLAAEEITGVEHAVGGQGVQPEGLVGEFEVREGLGERIDAGLEVADHPIGLDGGEDLPLGGGVDRAGGRGAFAGLRREAEAEFEAFEE